MTLLVRFFNPDTGNRIGLLNDNRVTDITDTVGSLTAFLQSSVGRVQAAIDGLLEQGESYDRTHFDQLPEEGKPHWLPPVEDQDVWASGVTYERSRSARQEEAVDGGDVYARVYSAERPELFFKARGTRVVGPYDYVGIRTDSTWNVPEPELALVMNPAMEVIGITIGNDMSSRDIEGENPLYLPQAKVYTKSCALGPGILLGGYSEWPQVEIALKITRDGQTIVDTRIHTDSIHRKLHELVEYLGRSNHFPDGVFLLTGTGIVPDADFTLTVGDQISINIDGVGTLTNTVTLV